MSDDTMIGLVSLLGFLVLVVVGLKRRNLPARTWAVLLMTWVAIIALAWAAATLGLRLLH